MEVTKRDIFVSIAALLILAAVLVPSLVFVKHDTIDDTGDNELELTTFQNIHSSDLSTSSESPNEDNETSLNSNESLTEDNTSPTADNESLTQENTSPSEDNEGNTADNKGTTEGNEGTTKDTEDRTETNEGNTDDNEGTTEDNEGTTEDNEGTTEDSEGTTEDNEGTTEDNEATKQASTETSKSVSIDSAASTSFFEIRNPKVVQVSNFKMELSQPEEETTSERVQRILSTVPLIDGHNDFPMSVREHLQNDVEMLHFDCDLTKLEPWASDSLSHTDLLRLRKGRVGGQFWSAYMDCDTQYKDAVQLYQEQIDVIKQLVRRYPDDLQWADSADGIEAAFRSGKIASLVGVESGHAIGSSLAVLRTLYDSGARYMTLTHSCNTPWADAAQAESGDFAAENQGISEFGEKVVLEMNRLGMMVDLAHVSSDTMRDVLKISRAPVIFSHSGARGVSNNVRNVPDDVLEIIKKKGGIVMANFYSCYIIDDCEKNNATINDVVKHINHIRKVAGVDHVGIGGDYNGVGTLPIGLEDVSGYPKVFEALINDNTFKWTDDDLEKLAGKNILGVFREVEQVRDSLVQNKVDNTWIDIQDFNGKIGCRSGL